MRRWCSWPALWAAVIAANAPVPIPSSRVETIMPIVRTGAGTNVVQAVVGTPSQTMNLTLCRTRDAAADGQPQAQTTLSSRRRRAPAASIMQDRMLGREV